MIDLCVDGDVLEDVCVYGYCVYMYVDWVYVYVSVDGEYVYESVCAFGAASEELRGGTLYRIGFGLFECEKEYVYMFDGDGLVL